MKKIFALAMILCLSVGMSFAKTAKSDDKSMGKEVKVTGIVTDAACAKSGDKAKMTDSACAKKCIEGDGKMAFVNDKDGSVWSITNPEALKGHEGHHVTLKGHANAADNSFHVMSASMVKDKAEKKAEHKM
jgi:hypothetical protein